MNRLFASVAVIAGLSGVADARPRPPQVVVTAPPTLAEWSARLSRDLDHRLVYPMPILNQERREGYVAIRFHCSEAGVPADLTVRRSSGSVMLDKAAMRAIARLKTLHPLPVDFSHERVIEARVIYARNEEGYRRLLTVQRNEAATAARQPRPVADVGPPPVILAAGDRSPASSMN